MSASNRFFKGDTDLDTDAVTIPAPVTTMAITTITTGTTVVTTTTTMATTAITTGTTTIISSPGRVLTLED